MIRRSPPLDVLFDMDRAGDNHQGIEPIYTASEILAVVEELAVRLNTWFDEEPVAYVVMNGAMIFAADLVRAMASRGSVMELDFLTVKKDRREGTVRMVAASERPVEGRDVLIIDDIFETGKTLKMVKSHFEQLGAQSVTSVVLLDKSNGRETVAKPDYKGFDCPDVFVIGYGMDIGYRYRELPFIGRMGQA